MEFTNKSEVLAPKTAKYFSKFKVGMDVFENLTKRKGTIMEIDMDSSLALLKFKDSSQYRRLDALQVDSPKELNGYAILLLGELSHKVKIETMLMYLAEDKDLTMHAYFQDLQNLSQKLKIELMGDNQ